MLLTSAVTDRENAIRPYVVVKAHRSPYCGWMLAVHASYKSIREAKREANVILRCKCPYVRIEKWPNADGGEVVVSEFGNDQTGEHNEPIN